ncbi:hypothetical protein UFOVP453_53 [uncultured Caudovirales phage]|uniref:Uncharacterized protein n=1 Tax=uncultured Caudovirales phage TaxID=2100421 RepID=A0A6J5MDJ0_9CAUD|nr:hypothetical protein UFOVP453_53 [uncultured Caudovirales phage]
MNVTQMIQMINANVDDVVDNTTAVRWLNAGQNQMAAEARASFTQLSANNLNGTFDFPEKYHETPVLYACAMYQSSESSIGEKTSYLTQFQDGLKTFLETYDVPMTQRDDSNTQQFMKTPADANTYTITKRGYVDGYKSNLKVYINNVETTLFTINSKTFTLTEIVGVQILNDGDKITAQWEDRPEMVEPPYTWWKAW